MKHCLTFLPDAYLDTKIPDMSGKNLTYGNDNKHLHLDHLLSSRCILNMKRLVTPKYKQGKTSKTSSENNLKVRRQPHQIVKAKKKHWSV